MDKHKMRKNNARKTGEKKKKKGKYNSGNGLWKIDNFG